MIKSCIFREIRYNRLNIPLLRTFSHEFTNTEPQKDKGCGSEKEKVGSSTDTNSAPMVMIAMINAFQYIQFINYKFRLSKQ